MSTWYQMELIAKDRQEGLRREAEQMRMHRKAGGRTHGSAKPRRLRLFTRS